MAYKDDIINNMGSLLKLGYLMRVMKFKALKIDEKDKLGISLIKGQRTFNLIYDESKDLYNIELYIRNSTKKFLDTGKFFKTEKKLNGIYVDGVREIFENHFRTKIYNLI